MEFFDKLGKKASEAYKITADKTGKIAKETKLKIKISQLRTNVSDLYEEIGKKVYEEHIREDKSAKENIKDELEHLCTKIDVLSDEIEDLLQQCLDLRDRKQCKNCYVEMDKECKYCPNCGAKQNEENNEDSEEDFQNVSLFEADEENKKEDKEKNDNKDNKEGTETKVSNLENLERTVKVESNVDKDEVETEVKNENSESEDNDDTTMY